MAQKLRDDKIGTLTHSAGNITMAASLSNPAYLTIGGQQYKITSNLVVALPSLTANSRYQVFAVQSAGVVSLVISQNENSVGPAGYNRWKLVGSLMTNQSLSFGSFISTTGIPVTNTFLIGTCNITASTAPPVKGTVLIDAFYGRRNGDKLSIQGKYRQTVAGTLGSGTYILQPPTNLAIDLTKLQVGIGAGGEAPMGDSFFTGGGSNPVYPGSVTCINANGFILNGQSNLDIVSTYAVWDTGSSSTSAGFNQTNMEFAVNFEFPVSGWSNTPIEDL